MGLITPSSGTPVVLIDNVSPFESPYGMISINATVPQYSDTIPSYHGTFGQNGSMEVQLQPLMDIRPNATSASDAPEVAQQILQSYGGFPNDAELIGSGTSYLEYFENGTRVAKKPVSTRVSYSRLIDGMWIIGDNNRLILELGNSGELIWLEF
jgi:hypothetical protein